MSHKPIFIKDISLFFDKKSCFSHFSATIPHGVKIAIMGANGAGKTSLLKMLRQTMEPSSGQLILPDNLSIGYVPQVINEQPFLSGGERFLKALSNVFAQQANMLLLDEPTNHLDAHNKRSLLKMLQRYQETLVVVTHDEELLRTCADVIWNIEGGKIDVFQGRYDDYLRERQLRQDKSVDTFMQLKKEQKKARVRLQFEEERAAKSKKNKKSRQEKDRSLRQKMKETASKTSGKNRQKITDKKNEIETALSSFKRTEVIRPTFTLPATLLGANKQLLSIVQGGVSYEGSEEILRGIYLSLHAKDRLLLTGRNGSGKTTLLKAIIGDPRVVRSGEWKLPAPDRIGYLDQHYATLVPEETVLENLRRVALTHSAVALRTILSTFLFRTNEEVQTLAKNLSGGEKARLSLAQIASKTPALLILDELTNNIDLQTKGHLIQVLKEYPGALLIVSHDEAFIEEMALTQEYAL